MYNTGYFDGCFFLTGVLLKDSFAADALHQAFGLSQDQEGNLSHIPNDVNHTSHRYLLTVQTAGQKLRYGNVCSLLFTGHKFHDLLPLSSTKTKDPEYIKYILRDEFKIRGTTRIEAMPPLSLITAASGRTYSGSERLLPSVPSVRFPKDALSR